MRQERPEVGTSRPTCAIWLRARQAKNRIESERLTRVCHCRVSDAIAAGAAASGEACGSRRDGQIGDVFHRAVSPDWRLCARRRWTCVATGRRTVVGGCQRGSRWSEQVRAMQHWRRLVSAALDGGAAAAKIVMLAVPAGSQAGCNHLLARRPPGNAFGIGSPGAGTMKNSAMRALRAVASLSSMATVGFSRPRSSRLT